MHCRQEAAARRPAVCLARVRHLRSTFNTTHSLFAGTSSHWRPSNPLLFACSAACTAYYASIQPPMTWKMSPMH